MQEDQARTIPPTGWRFGDFALYPAQRRLLHDGEPVVVEERAFDLLVLLAGHHDAAMGRREITEQLWGSRPVADTTLRQLLYQARRAVDDDGERQHVIRTVHGSLQWVAPLLPLDDDMPDLSAEAAATSAPVVEAAPKPAWRVTHHRWWWLAGALVVVGVAALAVRSAFAPLQAAPLRVAIAPIANQSGDKTMDWVSDGLPGLLAGLLGHAGGLDVVDPLQSTRAWAYQPQQGRSHEQQVRFATGASVLVTGRLRKLASDMYELDLQVEHGDATPQQISLAGMQPGVLAVDAVPRIRALLDLDKPALPSRLPHDAFLAQAYARGMDLAAHGKWTIARDYFGLCTHGAPDFLPAALQLGVAQARTNAVSEGERTLLDVVQRAVRQNDTRMQALALLQLGQLSRSYDKDPEALHYLQQAASIAKVSRNLPVEMQARTLLADVLHRLHQAAASKRQLQLAETMIAKHPDLRNHLDLLYATKLAIAGDQGDAKTALAAARAELAINVAQGNQRGTVSSLFNVANQLRSLHRDKESLALSARCHQLAKADLDLGMQFVCATNLAASLLNLGLPQPAINISSVLAPLAAKIKIAEYQVLALQIRSLGEMQRGDFAQALADLRKGDAVTDVSKLYDGTFLCQEIYEGLAAYVAEPGALPALSSRFDAIAKAHAGQPGFAQRQASLRALLAASRHQPKAALVQLRDAAAATTLSQDGDIELRMAPLLIALADNDQRAADIALKGYDPSTTTDAALLPLFVKWAAQRGDTNAASKARVRLAALRKQGTDAMVVAGLDPHDPMAALPTRAR